VHRLTWVLLATVALIVGCHRDPIPHPSRPDPVALAPAPKPGVDYVAIIGDSDTQGSAEGGEGPAGWPALVTIQLKNQGITIEPRVNADVTSGYTKSRDTKARSFTDRVAGAAGANDQLVVLFGSRNDEYAAIPPNSAFALTAAVQDTMAKVRERAPNAKILVIGPPWTAWADDDPTPAILLVRDTLKAQAEAAGAVFVDPIADQWFVDRPDLIGSDGVNPTDQGHVYMADKIAPVMAQLLRPPPPEPPSPPHGP
jgi:lysophospholipase L1-like esterase